MTATLASRIASADAAYRRGQAHMTDQEFDALMAKLRATQPDHPMLRMPGGGDKLLSDFVGRNDKTKVRALPPVAPRRRTFSSRLKNW